MTLKDKLNGGDRFAASIGARLTVVEDGRAEATLTVGPEHINGAGVCQGGVMYTLADLAFAAVANCHGTLSLGVSNTITFTQSAQLGDTLTAECRERVNHHRLPYCDIAVRNQRGETLALMTGLAYRMRDDFPFSALQ